MEEIAQVLDLYYSRLYWKAFLYGILIPSLMFSVYYYFTLRAIRRQFEEWAARFDKAYNDMIIRKYEDEIKFLNEMLKREKPDDT
jgi:hypothetical protein